MRIVFVGSQNYGAKCLKILLKNKEDVKAVFTFEPDVHETWQNDFTNVLKGKKDIKLIKTKKLDNHAKIIKEMKPDVIFVIGWRTIIPKEIYDLPKYGCIGIHGSLLPKYRGFAPLNWALINGEKTVGASMFYIGDGTDTGDIIAQKSIRIKPTEDMASIKARFEDLIEIIFKEQYPLIKSGKSKRAKQKHAEATYGCMRIPEDGEIHWNQPAETVFNFIRALGKPYPGAFTYHKGKKVYVWKAKLIDDEIRYFGTPGSIIQINKGKNVLILTGDSPLEIQTIQPDGEKEKCAGDYFKSIRDRLGLPISD